MRHQTNVTNDKLECHDQWYHMQQEDKGEEEGNITSIKNNKDIILHQ